MKTLEIMQQEFGNQINKIELGKFDAKLLKVSLWGIKKEIIEEISIERYQAIIKKYNSPLLRKLKRFFSSVEKEKFNLFDEKKRLEIDLKNGQQIELALIHSKGGVRVNLYLHETSNKGSETILKTNNLSNEISFQKEKFNNAFFEDFFVNHLEEASLKLHRTLLGNSVG